MASQEWTPLTSFYKCPVDPSTGFHSCVMGTLPTEPSSQPLNNSLSTSTTFSVSSLSYIYCDWSVAGLNHFTEQKDKSLIIRPAFAKVLDWMSSVISLPWLSLLTGTLGLGSLSTNRQGESHTASCLCWHRFPPWISHSRDLGSSANWLLNNEQQSSVYHLQVLGETWMKMKYWVITIMYLLSNSQIWPFLWVSVVRKAGRDLYSKLCFQCLGSVLLIQSDQVDGSIFCPFYLWVLAEVTSPVILSGHQWDWQS